MTRRRFLKLAGQVLATAVVGAAVLSELAPQPPPKPKLTNAQKEAIFAQAMETPEGQEQLAMAMVEAIRRKTEEQRFMRRILPPDPLP